MYTYPLVHRRRSLWLAALLGAVLASLALTTLAYGDEENSGDPNDYTCRGGIKAGTIEPGSSETPVQYVFTCSGPITGYQLQSQVPLTGFESSPLVTDGTTGEPTTDSFSCGGEVPGYAVNCVGSTKVEFEKVSGQFSIGTALCSEPRVDPLLTVTYASVEKNVVTQAISGPFDLGRPLGCSADGHNTGTRLAPRLVAKKPKHHHKGHKAASGAKHGKKS